MGPGEDQKGALWESSSETSQMCVCVEDGKKKKKWHFSHLEQTEGVGGGGKKN